jgi:protein TonB
MFEDTLLESSSALRKKKRWPMATAFTVELLIAGIVVLIPLFSTGAISISSSHCPLLIPVKPMPLEPVKPVRVETSRRSGPTEPSIRRVVMLANDNQNAIHWKSLIQTTNDINEVTPPDYKGPAENKGAANLISDGRTGSSNVKPAGPKRITSVLEEAQLIKKVEPVYPRIAVLSGIQGQVKLHAIIARDGSIQSLNAISGHPLLVSAAIDAVRQWRYRPYILNGEIVEVETFIAVNFRKDIH